MRQHTLQPSDSILQLQNLALFISRLIVSQRSRFWRSHLRHSFRCAWRNCHSRRYAWRNCHSRRYAWRNCHSRRYAWRNCHSRRYAWRNCHSRRCAWRNCHSRRRGRGGGGGSRVYLTQRDRSLIVRGPLITPYIRRMNTCLLCACDRRRNAYLLYAGDRQIMLRHHGRGCARAHRNISTWGGHGLYSRWVITTCECIWWG